MFAAKTMLLTRETVSPFVTRDSETGNLMLNGSRFRFSGSNTGNDIGLVSDDNGMAYGGTANSGYYLTPNAQVDAVLDSAEAMNATVIRPFAAVAVNYDNPLALQPTIGVFDADGLEPLDYALQQCALRGIRMIIPLCDGRDDGGATVAWYTANTGGGAISNFWTRTATINAFKDQISFVLDHVNPYTGIALKNDPTILCWETGNELSSGGTVSDADWRAWMVNISTHIKTTLGAQQLLMDGTYDIWDDAEYLSNNLVDIYTSHAYGSFRDPENMAEQAAIAHTNGKAFIVGEYDWTDDSWFLDDLLDVIEESDIDGDQFWDLLAPDTSWGDGFTLHFPGTSDDMQSRGYMLADHALRMTGINPGQFLSDAFTGSNGTVLSSHTASTVWDKQDGWTGDATIQTNRIYAGSTEAHYYSSAVPPSSDYEVTATIHTASVVGYAGVLARAYTERNYSYAAYVWNNAGNVRLYIDYVFVGGFTNLAVVGITTPTVGSSHTLKFKVQGTALSVYWDGALVLGPVTHSSLPYAGRAGVILGGGGSTTTGFHIDSITAASL